MSGLYRWMKDHTPYIIVSALLLVLVVIVLWSRVMIVVRPGEAGVLYRMLSTGTVVDHVYSEGLYVLQPLNTMYIYDTRVQVAFHEVNVLTQSGLPIKLSLAVRYQPIYELLGILHQQVGPNYVDKIILPEIESALRRGIGNHTPEDIYTNKDGVMSKIITMALEEVGKKYIQVDDIIIRSVTLPESVAKSIETKLIEEQRLLAYVFKLKSEKKEAKRKRFEATGIMDYQKIISKTLTDKMIQWQAIQATLELAKSSNTKVVVIGSSKNGLPIILGDK